MGKAIISASSIIGFIAGIFAGVNVAGRFPNMIVPPAVGTLVFCLIYFGIIMIHDFVARENG